MAPASWPYYDDWLERELDYQPPLTEEERRQAYEERSERERA